MKHLVNNLIGFHCKGAINLFVFFIALLLASCSPSVVQSDSGISVKVNQNTGDYTIYAGLKGWTFKGTTGHALTGMQTLLGTDEIGKYSEIVFTWSEDIPYKASIRWYAQRPVVLFSLILPDGSTSRPEPFPVFTDFPSDLHTFSYHHKNFAPPQFKLNNAATPWLFFDDKLNSYIISPASAFLVSQLDGDGKKEIASSLTTGVKDLPLNFEHKTILVFDKGIGDAWNLWGASMQALYKRNLPAEDADPVLKYFGYWTDNGADYYYNYDKNLGYANTLLALKKKYDEEGIPLGYMQLDSWWYEKSIYDPEGKPDADHKNPDLPSGPWNRYGGLMSYTADPYLFPDGLAAFQKKLGLPLVTHNRWIDLKSPYHDQFKVSGYAATDPAFWKQIMNYLKESGVICYEQDWLNYIYDKSPEMSQNFNTGNDFTGGMADACEQNEMDMQYCMATPGFFLQGLKYNNLTTIRTSDDRFKPSRWRDFIYDSQLAYECGIYPWCDVFKSGEKGNMILSVLSAGPVGTGDSIGKENKSNIMLACRKDGVLVKPDVPLLPVDEDYVNEANGLKKPMLAFTCTKHNQIETGYIFAFSDSSYSNREFTFTPSKLGIKGKVAVLNPENRDLAVIKGGEAFTGKLKDNDYAYYILAPLNLGGIAFFGDAGKIAATGKKRIADIVDHGNLEIKVLFAAGETSVNLMGYSEKPVNSDKGELHYDSQTHIFDLSLPSNGGREVVVNIQPVK